MTMSSGQNAVVVEKSYPGSFLEDQGKVATLPIEKICCDPELQARGQLNRSVVREYSELMQAGVIFTPLQIVAVGNKFLLVDGYHRLEAAKLANMTKIRCLVREGDRRHAILLSSMANVRHGLRRTNADKWRAVTKVLTDPEWRQWSDHQIARHCQVTQPFVSGVRSKMREVADNIISDNALKGESTERRYITKHGRPAVMRLPARRRPCAVTGEPIEPVTEVPSRGTAQAEVVAVESVQVRRAHFIEVVVTCEKIIRSTDVTAIRTDPATDDALCNQLKAFADLILSKANLLIHRG